MKLSQMAEGLVSSEIIRLAGEINRRKVEGENIYNLTIGDFDPSIFPIPELLREEIERAYREKLTNYPMANGMLELREGVAVYLRTFSGLTYSPDDILISSGARPLIFATYKAIIDPGDLVVFPVPSWNNNHYCHLEGAQAVAVETRPEDNFMPTAALLAPHLSRASLLSLCSPLNPTGTVFQPDRLAEICDLVLEENSRRGPDRKPLYVLFDQIYWMLTHGETTHCSPVSVRPEMRPYTIFVDGLSKAFAATGVRVGWAFGPAPVIQKMRAITSHLGAWAPKAEQVACGRFLKNTNAVADYVNGFKKALEARLKAFYQGFVDLKSTGLPVNAIAPQAAIYLTVQLNLSGYRTQSGDLLTDDAAVHRYVLDQAGVGLVPFSAFGSSRNASWYRLSVGTTRLEDIPTIIQQLKGAFTELQPN